MKRFWDKTKQLDNGCIEWTACKNECGYGIFALSSKRKNVFAHRAAWLLAGLGEVPDGLILMHACDNPACVNIEHLRIGTQAENIADKVSKNRQAKGTKHGNAKLTDETVKGIRASTGKQRDIAKQFGVSQATVHMVRSRKYWAHI